MRVMVTNRNQITIPKNLINELGIELGKYYELDIKDNKIILDISNSYDTNEDDNKVNSNLISDNVESKSKVKIESNLEEGKKFSRQVYSECGLVIRTKSSYMRKFCEQCRGQLSIQYGSENHPCRYLHTKNEIEDVIINKEEPKISNSKKIINELVGNVQKLNNNIDNKISNIKKEYP